MRQTTLPNVALAASISFCGCSQTETMRAPGGGTVHSYGATDGSPLRSTLFIEDKPGGRQLAGVTQLDDDTCIAEEATLAQSGRLMHAEYTLSRNASPSTHVTLDPMSGLVEVTGPTFQLRWSVPNDLPWVWTPLLDAATLATPVAALVTLRGARADSAVRSIDLRAFQSFSVMADQLVVANGEHAELVVVGDDAVEVQHGVPSHWHLGALDRDIQARESNGLLRILAAFACMPLDRSET
jgi:hypothetical protein